MHRDDPLTARGVVTRYRGIFVAVALLLLVGAIELAAGRVGAGGRGGRGLRGANGTGRGAEKECSHESHRVSMVKSLA